MCPDELSLMVFADNERPFEPGLDVAAHVGGCRRCAALVELLRSETRALHEGIAAREWAPDGVTAAAGPSVVLISVPPAAERSDLREVVGAMAIVVGAVRLGLDALTQWSTVVLPDWLNPFMADGRLNTLSNLAWYVVERGGTMGSSMALLATLSAMGVLGWAGLTTVTRARRQAGPGTALIAGVLLAATAAPANALEIRRGQSPAGVTVASGDTVDDTLIAMGDEIVVEGTVTGDLVALGRSVRIRGTVRGNLFTFARQVDVSGSVGGSLFLFGQTLRAGGDATGNLTAFGQTVTLDGTAAIAGNVTTFSETATIDGTIGRDVTSFGQRLQLDGAVRRQVLFYGRQVDVRPTARIDGRLTAHVDSRENVQVAAGAIVAGGTDVRVDDARLRPNRYASVGFYVRQAIRVAAAFVAGWLLLWLVPALGRAPVGSGRSLAGAALIGAIALVATPVLAVAVGITLVGLPVALTALMLWLVLLYLAKIVLAARVGRHLVGRTDQEYRVAPTLLLGLVLMVIVINLPFVGGLLNLVLTITGLGILVAELRRWTLSIMSRERAAPAA